MATVAVAGEEVAGFVVVDGVVVVVVAILLFVVVVAAALPSAPGIGVVGNASAAVIIWRSQDGKNMKNPIKD